MNRIDTTPRKREELTSWPNERKTRLVRSFLIWTSALLVILSVLTVVFFPGAAGPFAVLNGPATAFRAARAARSIHVGIVAGGTGILANVLFLFEAVVLRRETSSFAFPSWPRSESHSSLRC